jgi:hypothetical protein
MPSAMAMGMRIGRKTGFDAPFFAILAALSISVCTGGAPPCGETPLGSERRKSTGMRRC